MTSQQHGHVRGRRERGEGRSANMSIKDRPEKEWIKTRRAEREIKKKKNYTEERHSSRGSEKTLKRERGI